MFAARFDPGGFEDEIDGTTFPLKRTSSDAELDSDESETGDENTDIFGAIEDKLSNETVQHLEPVDGTKDPEEIETTDKDVDMEDELPSAIAKHTSVLQRFQNIKRQDRLIDEASGPKLEDDKVEEHDLAPLPQPELPKDFKIAKSLTNNSLKWLAEPQYIKVNETKPFKEFEISSQILKNLKEQQFENAFSVQIKTLAILLPEINNKLNPNSIKGDLLVNASTGSGKTLAYSIPVIQALSTRVVPKLRCVVLVPTKPLINQVLKTMIALSKGINLNIVTLGKNELNLNDEKQKLLSNIPDIIISTPGRFVDHLNLKSFDLKSLEWCIIDEADRLMNQSYQDWSNVLISKISEINQDVNMLYKFHKPITKMLFSATLTTDAGKLSNLKFNNPRLIIVNNEESVLKSQKIFQLPMNLKEYYLRISTNASGYKPLYLIKLITKQFNPIKHILIFTRSNESALRLSRLLQLLSDALSLGLVIDNINSSLSKSEKNKKLEKFGKGKIDILIATDLIARGIDISTIKHVLNYDLPNSSREYVHRVGRTARAKNEGDAYSIIVGKGEFKFWKNFNGDISRCESISEVSIEKDEVEEETLLSIYNNCLKDLEKQVFDKS